MDQTQQIKRYERLDEGDAKNCLDTLRIVLPQTSCENTNSKKNEKAFSALDLINPRSEDNEKNGHRFDKLNFLETNRPSVKLQRK